MLWHHFKETYFSMLRTMNRLLSYINFQIEAYHAFANWNSLFLQTFPLFDFKTIEDFLFDFKTCTLRTLWKSSVFFICICVRVRQIWQGSFQKYYLMMHLIIMTILVHSYPYLCDNTWCIAKLKNEKEEFFLVLCINQ